MNYKNGFAIDEFLEFIYNEFPNVYDNLDSRKLLENLVDCCVQDEINSTMILFSKLERLIPEIRKDVLLSFFDKKTVPPDLFDYCKKDKFKFEYMLLGRCKQDCEYFLGYGNRSTNQLYGKDVKNHISIMKELYEKVPIKPEWLSKKDIENYEKRMLYSDTTIDKLIDAIEEEGWNIYDCSFGDNEWEINKYSPAGEDFSFIINHEGNANIAIRKIKEYAEDFDIDEHVEMWIEARHNNVKGVPSASILVKDAIQIQEMLDKLANYCNSLEIDQEMDKEELEEDELDL